MKFRNYFKTPSLKYFPFPPTLTVERLREIKKMLDENDEEKEFIGEIFFVPDTTAQRIIKALEEPR